MSDTVYFKGPVLIRTLAVLPAAGAFDPDPLVAVDLSYAQSVEISVEYTGALAGNQAVMAIEVFDGEFWRPLGQRNPAFVVIGVGAVNDIVPEILRLPAGTSVTITLPPLEIRAQGARFRFAEVGNPNDPGTLRATAVTVWVRR